MSPISQIDITTAHEWIQAQDVTILDIRDPMSFAEGHIPNAIRIDGNSVQDVIEKTDKNKKIVVCCYHGISSQDATHFFTNKGFNDAHSLMGGFEAWAGKYPSECDQGDT